MRSAKDTAARVTPAFSAIILKVILFILRKIKNLRRIAVTPWADVEKCAEQIRSDYVCSWRPNPATMVCSGFDADFVRNEIINGLNKFCKYGCIVDITLKDVQTLEGQPERIKKWCEIVRSCVANN